MGSSCSTVACIKSNHMTLRCIGSRFITWHYMHIYVVSSIAIYLVKTHKFLFISPGVWLSSKDSSKLLRHVICVVFWLVRNHTSSEIDMSWRFDKFASTIWKYDSIQTFKLYWEMPHPDSCSHKTCCWISVFKPNCCIQGHCGFPTFHWVHSYHVC